MSAEDRAWAHVREHLSKPIDMVLHCPACGLQHIDGVEAGRGAMHYDELPGGMNEWNNPPHRSHLCHGCGHIWRPADVPTNGVAAVKTKGTNDSPIVRPRPAQVWVTSDPSTAGFKR